MLGILLTLAAGALVFKLGMDAGRKSDDGKSVGEIASELPKDACDTVKDVFGCGCCGGYAPDDEEFEEQEKKQENG